jgi:acyl-CoA hydrolase
MSQNEPAIYQNAEKCADQVIKRVGSNIVLGMPLGLGKANHVANAIYRRAAQDPSINLTIITALSLERPTPTSELERRFLEPFIERVFGGYVDLEYVSALRNGTLPSNIEVKEFYTKAGAFLKIRHVQQNYISSNYTHAYRDILINEVNVVAQIVCKRTINGKTYFSTSCNPEVILDVVDGMRKMEKAGRKIAIIAQINQNLPFMYGDAVVEPNLYTDILDHPDYSYRLFSAPKMSVNSTDYAIGLHASTLIKDGGTLQIGIGSLGDALCYGLQLRQTQNTQYQDVLKKTEIATKFGKLISFLGGVETFKKGLVGSTEMLVDGYLHLIKCGVVKRKTYNNVHIQRLINEGKIKEKISPGTLSVLLEEKVIKPKLTRKNFQFLQDFGIFSKDLRFEKSHIIKGKICIAADLNNEQNLERVVRHCLGTKLKNGILIHAGFFLGPNSFYAELKEMPEQERRQIYMTSVLNVNQLYGNQYGDEELKLLQRKHGRFVNACLMATLTGAVCSDGLESGQMVSGVGGQYNFVSQAHALPGGRSILMLKSTRQKNKDVSSNIVWRYGHITIPKHLRDIVITEYGIADLRAKSDKDVIAALLNITDSRFQEELLNTAKRAKKIPDNYQIPDEFKNNLPERIEQNLAPFKDKGFFPPFPFGTDFTEEELVIGQALKWLKERMTDGLGSKASNLGKAMTVRSIPVKASPYLQRMQLDDPTTAKEHMMQKLVVYALSASGAAHLN